MTKKLELKDKAMQKKLEDSLKENNPNKADDILAAIRARQGATRIHYTDHLKFIQTCLKATVQEILELNNDLVYDETASEPYTAISKAQKKQRINENAIILMQEIDRMGQYVQNRDLDAEREQIAKSKQAIVKLSKQLMAKKTNNK